MIGVMGSLQDQDLTFKKQFWGTGFRFVGLKCVFLSSVLEGSQVETKLSMVVGK